MDLVAMYRPGADEAAKLTEPAPKFTNKLRSHRAWSTGHPPYVCEVLGSLQFIVVGVLSLATHLQAFKPRWADKHKEGA